MSLHFRAFPTTLERRGQHELSGRLVPYGEVADVLDVVDGKPEIYREGFRRGAFADHLALMATNKGVRNRIHLVHRHEGGLGQIGQFKAIRDEPDGLWGDAVLLPTKADDVEMLLDMGVDELSIEFRLTGAANTVTEDGVRWRTRAHLEQVALEPKGAYSNARVMAYRAEIDDEQRAAAEAAAAAAAAEAKVKADEELLTAQALVAEAQAAEAAERKRQWDLLTGRLDADMAKQRELVKAYGLTQPGGFRRG
jgi:HK97 family phage prohead protease